MFNSGIFSLVAVDGSVSACLVVESGIFFGQKFGLPGYCTALDSSSQWGR
ncbi:hypothetical protein T4E_9491 [Trichinella pseudospiralis]|uniref:Uncharacterized protein n=1 Tax=Trichinella pseudospiralis TaxID=6337 RepID=A0A0V0XYG3_TRIPS|nr:hypothetical protein T4E_9491 [Trichinella pseudospiralis]